MTFAKLSDDYSDDCWSLSDAAYRLHTDALGWNARKLLDCKIPKADLPRFSRAPHVAAELVTEGFWTDFGSYYEILHHAKYQPTREGELHRQSINRANGSKGGRPPKATGGRRERSMLGRNVRKTEQLTDSRTRSQSESLTASVTSPGMESTTRLEPARGKNPVITREQNPIGNPIANPLVNPQGVVPVKGSTSTEAKASTGLDWDAWPTNDDWISKRSELEERGISTVDDLMESDPGLDREWAVYVLAQVFPGRFFS